MNTIKDKLPEKGKDIIGYDSEDNEYFIFRCNCPDINCNNWRCSLTGYEVITKIIKWKYI